MSQYTYKQVSEFLLEATKWAARVQGFMIDPHVEQANNRAKTDAEKKDTWLKQEIKKSRQQINDGNQSGAVETIYGASGRLRGALRTYLSRATERTFETRAQVIRLDNFDLDLRNEIAMSVQNFNEALQIETGLRTFEKRVKAFEETLAAFAKVETEQVERKNKRAERSRLHQAGLIKLGTKEQKKLQRTRSQPTIATLQEADELLAAIS